MLPGEHVQATSFKINYLLLINNKQDNNTVGIVNTAF